MTEAQIICEHLTASIEGALACGVVNLTNGDVHVWHSNVPPTDERRQAFSRSSLELFEYHAPSTDGTTPANDRDGFEVQLCLTNSRQFGKVLGHTRIALVLLTKRNANAGMSWAQLKEAAQALTPIFEAEHESSMR